MNKILLLGLLVILAPSVAGAEDLVDYTNPETVEERVRDFFADTPVMIEIARCESNFRQFTDAGNVLRGGSGGGMVGVFQFFESVHTSAATSLGHDITTLEGNIAYAKHVYEQQGTTPWNSARSCWENAVSSETVSKQGQTDLQNRINLLLQIIELLKQIQLLRAQL